MTGFERRILNLNRRKHRRMMRYHAAVEAGDRDESWHQLTVACRLGRKADAARAKARLRGEDL